jgi:inosine/xanthosine triphosphatase
MIIAVGSKNPAKISAAKIAFKKIFPKEKLKIIGVEAPSKVSVQPKTDKESMRGAINRAKNADWGVGMEGGIHKIGKNWFESGWIAVVDKNGAMGLATSARWQVSGRVLKKLGGNKELSRVFEELAQVENAKDAGGVMSLISNNHLPRDIAYSHGVIFALSPFISNPKFWD